MYQTSSNVTNMRQHSVMSLPHDNASSNCIYHFHKKNLSFSKTIFGHVKSPPRVNVKIIWQKMLIFLENECHFRENPVNNPGDSKASRRDLKALPKGAAMHITLKQDALVLHARTCSPSCHQCRFANIMLRAVPTDSAYDPSHDGAPCLS